MITYRMLVQDILDILLKEVGIQVMVIILEFILETGLVMVEQ